jgi:HPt (histidine-containing phosphotransfer) domain-containing protein
MKDFNAHALSEIIELEETGEDGLVEGLINDYLSNCPTLIQVIETSALNKDYSSLERAIHSFKSSSSLVGLELTAEVALEIEYQAREQTFSPGRFEELKSRLEMGRKELAQFQMSRNRK